MFCSDGIAWLDSVSVEDRAALDQAAQYSWVRINQWVAQRPYENGTTIIATENGICTRHYRVTWRNNKPEVVNVNPCDSLVGHRLTYKTLRFIGYTRLNPLWRNTVTREEVAHNPFTR